MTTQLIEVKNFPSLSVAVEFAGLRAFGHTLVLVGGASNIIPENQSRLESVFATKLGPLLEKMGVAVITGGTDAGIMRYIGKARTSINGTFPLIGVAARGTIVLPPEPPPREDAAPLEPNHTTIFLVPGKSWGDESPSLCSIASLISEGFSSVTLVVNGGDITLQDVGRSILAERSVVTLDGTGRAADKLAAALRGEPTDLRAEALASSGQVKSVHLTENSATLIDIIAKALNL
jgi:hypothetical protein